MAESLENSPSLFLGKPWSEWASRVEDEDELNRSKHSSGHEESMRLKRDDMPLFGLCPAQDEFYLVVCETCKQVVKPQALLRHMEVRHGQKSKNYSPRRRKTSSTSSTTLSPTMSPPRDDRRVHSGSKSSKHDVHGKTPPDDRGGGTKRSSHDGSGFNKSSSSRHHHALSNAALSLHKSDKLQRNHSMPVVKMERLPPTMSAKNNAPTLHMPPSSIYKPASKSNKSNSKDHRDKSKSSSSHLSRGHETSRNSSKDEHIDINTSSEAKSLNKSGNSDLSKLSDDEDLFSLSRLQSKMKAESSYQSKGKSDSKHYDTDKHDTKSAKSNDLSTSKKHSSSGHSHSSHHNSDGSKSNKHKHSHSSERSSSNKHAKHSEHSEGSTKQKQEKTAWGGSGRSKSPEKSEGSKHNSSKSSAKLEWNRPDDKHDGNDSSTKPSSKSNDIGKIGGKGSDSGKHSSSTLSDKQWNDITKLSSGSQPSEKIESLDIMKVEDPSEDEATSGLDDIVKFNGTSLISTAVSSKSDSHLQSTHNGSKSSKHGLSSSNLDSAYKPPALNLSLTSSSSCDGTTGKASLTSPTTPVLTSPETSVPTTPIVTSTKHLDKIDINSPTSTFGKKLAALHNPGKLLPCKDREYNPDIHCGVISKEDNKPCTRSLTCKSHALSLRRAVPGRCKPFDELLLEHRAAKEAYLLSKQEAGHASGKGSSKTPSTSKSSHSSSKIKSPPVTMSNKSPSVHSTTNKVTPMTTPPPPAIKMPKIPLSTTSNAVHKVLPLSVQLPPKPIQIADLPASEPVPVPELFAPAATSDNEDDDDYRDRMEYPSLPHHPRPAVVNCFGGRNTGSGCYVFNRKNDQLRAVFRLAVDRRLHPPPQKKLCLDSKFPVASSITGSSKDPYEFGTGSPNVAAKGAKSNKSHKSPGSTGNKSQKAKEEVGGINYSAVYEPFDPVGGGQLDTTAVQGLDVFTTGQPTITTAASLISQSSNARSSSGGSAGPSAKRKRSGSSPRPALSTSNTNSTASIGGFALNSANNAISIAIPTGSLNLNLSSTTLNSLNATFAGNKLSQLAANKNNLIKDVNIMVTGGTSTVLNGQILTSIPSSNLTDVTQIQLKNSLSSPPQKSKSRKRTSSRSASGSGAQDSSAAGTQAAPSVFSAIPGGAVFMDSSPGNLISSNSMAMVTTSSFGMVSTPVTSPSPAMTPSPLFTAGPASSIPNGIIGQQGAKNMTSLNHVGSAAVGDVSGGQDGTSSPIGSTPLSDTTINTLEHHISTPSKHSKKQSHKHMKALQQQQHQVAAQSFTSQPSRLITSSVPYSIHGNTVGVPGALSGSGYSHIQIQPKDLASGGAGKTLATGKLSMQPMSLTIPIMAPGPLPEGLTVMQGQGHPQRALLIPTPTESTDRAHHRHAHESIPQLTLQNSPSNLIS